MEWCTDFCLSCDQQTNGSAYCSQACRMADLDRVNPSPSFEPSSPLSSSSSTGSPVRSSFYLAPAIDFANYRSSPVSFSRETPQTSPICRTPLQRNQTSPTGSASISGGTLRTSTSGMSLSSIHSNSTTLNNNNNNNRNSLSQQSRNDLSAYANAFDEVRLLKRRKSLY